MSGRGFLKSRLAQLTSKELEESPKPHESPKPEEPSNLAALPILHNGIPKVPMAVNMSSQTFNNGYQQVARGRRAILAKIAQRSGAQKLCDDITTTFSNIDSGNLKDIVRPSISPEYKKAEVSELLTLPKQPQTQTVDNPAEKEKKSPVICRVLEDPKRTTYKMTQLSSNYLRIILEEDKGLYEYQVEFNPPVDAKSDRIVLVNQHKDLFPAKSFDGTLLCVPKMLPQNVTTLVGKSSNESNVTVTITFMRKKSLSECIQFYNVLLHSIMKILGLIGFGRSYYDQNKKILVPEFKLEIWPGFSTTIDEFENGLYMCAEVSHRILRVQPVVQIMMDIMIDSKKNNKNGEHEILAAFCGSTVITYYNNMTYRIDDVDFTMNPLSTFEQNGVEVTYKDYYKNMYDIEILNLKQPMIISKLKKKCVNKNAKDIKICCLIPELCNLTGLTEEMKKNRRLMKVLHSHTLVTSEVRQNAIIEFVNRINAHEEARKKCKDWGLIIRPIPVKMEGPVYKREAIEFGNKVTKELGIDMDWGKDVVKNAMFVAVNMLNWAILYSPMDEPTAKSFCRQLAACGRPLGMNINTPKNIIVQNTKPEAYVNSIINTVKNNSGIQFIVIIFQNEREDRYNAVKRICCSKIGIPSQVIISRTLSRPERLQLITQKIALQINCKLGGACWHIQIPLSNTMIVGIDVYHEKNKQMSSVVGLVASMNNNFTEWYSVAVIQKSSHQEIMKSVQNAFNKILTQFKAKNGLFPEKIIIYRDGVSDGEFKYVEEIELLDLIKSFKSYPGNYNPMVTFIIVQKRINTRVFQYVNEKYLNPSPGTVVDNTITRRNYFDFFLVSQNIYQGSVNPTHYIVLQNGCNLSVENVQRLSYKLCHLYYNWCGTIKVPAPVQYAHKLAFLIGQNVREMPNDDLCNTLFFL